MSKILVLGRTMDMGGTEVAMAALLQKLCLLYTSDAADEL